MVTLNHSIQREHGFEKLVVEGVVPDALRGTMYRTGPGLLHRFNRPVAHPFDADGAVTAVRFSERGVHGASRVVRSPEFLAEERSGRFLYGTSASWLRQLRNRVRQQFKPTGNTNVLHWQRSLFALMEVARPIEIDADTLDARPAALSSIVAGGFSAHPHRVHSRRAVYNFGLRGDGVDLFVLPDVGEARVLGHVALPFATMSHDFIVSDRHIVFVLGPAKLVRWRAALAIGDLSKYFEWRPEEGTTIIVAPIDEPSRYVSFRVDPFWVWHFVNAFDDGERVIVDLCRHENFSAFSSPSDPSAELGTPTLTRCTIDPRARTLRSEALLDGPSEFPSVHPRWTGRRQRYTWVQRFAQGDRGAGLARFDNETARLTSYHAPSGHLGSEPMFVARSDREHEGWLLQLIQDTNASASYVAVFDAEHIEEGPIAKAWFRQAIPMTFHGTFVGA